MNYLNMYKKKKNAGKKSRFGIYGVEYAVMLLMITIALAVGYGLVRQGVSGRMKDTTDAFGGGAQFEPRGENKTVIRGVNEICLSECGTDCTATTDSDFLNYCNTNQAAITNCDARTTCRRDYAWKICEFSFLSASQSPMGRDGCFYTCCVNRVGTANAMWQCIEPGIVSNIPLNDHARACYRQCGQYVNCPWCQYGNGDTCMGKLDDLGYLACCRTRCYTQRATDPLYQSQYAICNTTCSSSCYIER